MTVLCYHSVQPHWTSPLAIPPADFQQQCAWLASHRRLLPLAKAIPRLDRSGRLPRGEAVLTFDDGFEATYEHVLPVVRRLRIPATVFLVAQTLTPHGQPVDWVDTPPPFPLTTLTLEQVLEMQELGVDFQSHSWAHHDLTQLGFDECVRDIRDSRELLEDLLGRPVRFLAYPRGRHNRQVQEASARAGFSHSFALPQSREEVGSHSLPRVGIFQGNSMPTVRMKCTRTYLPLRSSPILARARRVVRR